jgi:hypothetical protein
MGNLSFPWLALGLGLLVAIGLFFSGALSPDGRYDLPLLTMLIVNEFGFFVTAIGAGVGINMMIRDGIQQPLLTVVIACGILAAGFLYVAIKLWPGMGAS